MKKYFSLLLLLVLSINAWAGDIDAIEIFLKKHKISGERPKSCPLESKKFADLLARTESIKNIFKTNCLQKDDSKMTEILSSVKDIQDELKRRNIIEKTIDGQTVVNAITGSDTSATNSSNVSALSGIKFSNLFTNITTMIKKNQCNLDDGRVLEMVADLIYDSTQLGLLSGNELGLVVAGGGFVVSSALRLIDLIIKQRFDFEKNNDRQTFIKLNCSFYDIRKELENNGILEVDDSNSATDLKEAKNLITKTNESLKNFEQEKSDIKKTLEQLDQESLVSTFGNVLKLKKTLTKIRSALEASEQPAETHKLMVISRLAAEHDVLALELDNYRTLKISAVPMMDILFAQDIKKFDQNFQAEIMTLMNMPAKEFNETIKARILFHASRILNDIAIKEELISEKNSEVKKLKVLELQKKIDLYSARLVELKKVEEKLNRVVSPREYSASDDGTENILSIIDNYKNISEQIYGEWGEKFLKFSTYKSFDEAKAFGQRVTRFNAKYNQQLKKIGSIDSSSSPYICQDIQRIKVSFKYADTLVQEGYDFIVTNKDLFHTDNRNYYNVALDEETKDGASSIERIQRHYRSVILAVKKLKKEAVNPDDEDKYLSRNMMGNSYLGRSMLEVSNARIILRTLQEKFQELGCHQVLVDEIN